MRKVLIITLALLLAFAGSAMAEVTFGGSFTGKITQPTLIPFGEEFTVDGTLALNVGASDGGALDWSFSGGFGFADGKLVPAKYLLTLKDDYFTALAWGHDNAWAGSIGTDFAMVVGSGYTPQGQHGARIIVPIQDVANFSLQAGSNKTIIGELRGNAGEVEWVLAASQYPFGEYTHQYGEKPYSYKSGSKRNVAAQANYADYVGDMYVDFLAAVGLTLWTEADVTWLPPDYTESEAVPGDETVTGMGFGFKADVDVTDELSVNAQVTHGTENWMSDWEDGEVRVVPQKTIFWLGSTFSEQFFQVGANGRFALAQLEDDDNEVSLGVFANYRMSDALGYGDLFNLTGDVWATNDAPAFGVGANFGEHEDKKFDFLNARVDLTAPLVEDVVWGKVYGSYAAGGDFGAGFLAYVDAIPGKLVLKPQVDVSGKGQTINVQLNGSYVIGESDVALGFKAQKVFDEEEPSSELTVSVTVPF